MAAPPMGGRPFRGPSLLILLRILICGATLAISTPQAAPPSSQDLYLPSTNDLQKRVQNSYPLDTCQDGYAGWNFQQSVCEDHVGLRAWCIFCHAPGAQSMLEGPVHWSQLGTIRRQCEPSQLCVDGPYTPPDPTLLHLQWYKQYGTAHCVEMENLIGLGRAGLDVIMHQALSDRGDVVKMTGIYPPGADMFA